MGGSSFNDGTTQTVSDPPLEGGRFAPICNLRICSQRDFKFKLNLTLQSQWHMAPGQCQWHLTKLTHTAVLASSARAGLKGASDSEILRVPPE